MVSSIINWLKNIWSSSGSTAGTTGAATGATSGGSAGGITGTSSGVGTAAQGTGAKMTAAQNVGASKTAATTAGDTAKTSVKSALMGSNSDGTQAGNTTTSGWLDRQLSPEFSGINSLWDKGVKQGKWGEALQDIHDQSNTGYLTSGNQAQGEIPQLPQQYDESNLDPFAKIYMKYGTRRPYGQYGRYGG